MRVIICGAGQVGFGIAERLSYEGHDVSVIDVSARLITNIRDQLDVRAVVGHGSHPDVLAAAGAEDADLLIAVTQADEVNMVASQVAHTIFQIPTKIARVRAQSYLSPVYSSLFARDQLPIDVVISPEIEVGEMVMRRLALPGAVETVRFADGKITVVGILCADDCPVVDTPLRQLTELFPNLGSVVVGVFRQGHLIVPRSEDMLRVGDLVYVVAPRDQVRRTLVIFGHEEPKASRVVIAGGGNIGFYVAQQLELREPQTKVKIIEASRQRALEIADTLHRAVILNGSALDQNILREADIEDADTMVALTNDDQANIIACVMAKTLGCVRNLSLINNVSYPAFANALGIDAYVNPRAVTISRVLRHVRRGRIESVHSLQNGQAEVIEAEALETSLLVGRPLRDLDLPVGVRVGAIIRRGAAVELRGDTQILSGDRVIMFALSEKVHQVEQMFRVSLEFF
ncbi:Trk system potassium transporter TrkA [Acuticoccus sp. M5D2P5]|uniref:Trk system potassium transporter TrkA n=1 Tax=Acuticoccus kalidii TaxID=2910977 RepID=UPI001F36899E|nr:Trk system potassium transporter TrkA [Acuticoccus kalidii]MCF3932582.1 Trk system potassium transporter TrkA [Acuticoccus kalidii]